MPKTWHDRHSVNKIEDESERNFCRSIVADRKPYFMRYIYPALMKQYNTYIKNTDRNALREFQMTVREMQELPYDALTDRQKDFLQYYDYRMPVGIGDCVMNKICKRFESEFDGYIGKHSHADNFDYTIMKTDAEYTRSQYNAIKQLYTDYNKRLKSYAIFADYERVDDYESGNEIALMNREFYRQCVLECSNEELLCNIILDICYTRSATKKFAWSMCGENIIHNLRQNNNNRIKYPTLDENGDIEFCGNRFSLITKQIGVDK